MQLGPGRVPVLAPRQRPEAVEVALPAPQAVPPQCGLRDHPPRAVRRLAEEEAPAGRAAGQYHHHRPRRGAPAVSGLREDAAGRSTPFSSAPYVLLLRVSRALEVRLTHREEIEWSLNTLPHLGIGSERSIVRHSKDLTSSE